MSSSVNIKQLSVIIGCLFPVAACSFDYDILHGLFCDLSTGSKVYRKTDCLCIEFIDKKNMATFNYRKGKKIQGKTYSYEVEGARLTVDMRGDGGLDYVELVVKSKDTIVSQFLKSKNGPVSFERQTRLPEICW